jgi:hypothetical protein
MSCLLLQSKMILTSILSRFVDRDMLMRYRGGGVGHKSTRAATDKFIQDRDELDLPDYVAPTGDGENVFEDGGAEKEVGDTAMQLDDDSDNDSVEENLVGAGYNLEEEDKSIEDDEDHNDAAFEEEFDYGYELDYEGAASDKEGQDAEELDDVLGSEDSREDDEDDDEYADL